MPTTCNISTSTAVKTMFRMLDTESMHTKIHSLTTSNSQLKETLANQGKLPDALVNFLVQMDKKLDTILGHLQKNSFEQNFPHSGIISSLSVSCAVLKCKEPLAPQDRLELLFIFQDFPLQVVSVFAEVKELEHGNDTTLYHLHFIDLEHEDRESIIKFLFQEERRRIRLQKENTGQD